MAMAIRVFLLLLLFFSSSYPTFSLYEDQIGLMDWHQQYIGKVKHAVFHTQKAGRKRVVVFTEENVVASLDLRSGEIFWRHVLGTKDAINEIDIALGKYVITMSSEGSMLRAWNLPDGQMVWESFLSGLKPSKSLLSVPFIRNVINYRSSVQTSLKVDKDNLVLVYSNGCLHAVSIIDGEILWKKDLTTEGIEVQQLVQPLGSDIIYAVGFGNLPQFDACQINAKNGELLKHDSATFPGGFSGELLSVSSDTFVASDATRSILVLISIRDGSISFRQTYISDFVQDFSGTAVLLPSKITGIFAIKIDTFTVLIRVTVEGKLEVVDKIDQGVAISDVLSFSEGQQAFALVQQGRNKIQMTVKHSHDWNSGLLEESIEMDQQRGLVHKVFINHYLRTDKSYGFRALIVMEDHSLLLVQQGEIVWSREDGLASVVDVTTAELPVEKDGVSVAKVEQNLFEWLKGHLLKLKGTLMLAGPNEVAEIQRIRLKSTEKSKMTRDNNGFRKLLIVLTRAGKLFALHTGDGRVVWSLLLHSLRKSEGCESPIGLNIYQWQVPHHHAMDENPSVLVVGRCGYNLDAPGVLSIVDTYTGMELNPLGATHSIVQVIPLPFTDSTEQRLHLLIDSDQHAHLYPRTREAISIFQREFANIYWYSVEVDNGVLRGHVLKDNCILEVADEYCFNTRDLWSIVFPSESEKIIATVTRKSSEVVHTQAKVIAEQDVMYKYVSQNVIFVATIAPKAIGEIGSVTPEESWLVVYLIDTVTGRILHRMIHHGSQGPVHAVFSENWVVYQYFNLRAHRYEMSVIEIYDQSRADNKDVWRLVLGKHNLTSPLSSFSRPEVITKSQSYFFTHTAKAIAVTSTSKGITSKQLLIGTVGDQVLALDKRFLDPRRTVNPTQAEKEEGLLPLTDSLPIMPQSYVTHALKVEGLRGIVTMPAKLESTTLAFIYGVDLFFTRLAPSKTYDSLTEDFSYALLLITIVALVLAIIVTWVLSERKDLQEKWR
ncbi:ER membrane protein complex subunit 1 like [Actinidia chinensis var. chinensis]|uniref:ER membrane protein complex subunit 1 n=1 Tax=Actinidia chinensis var. chinensis TaxID=1590841 RepID=A0A2R6Q2U6_ACTCC|nr:ER membrane protein complex subunit 1 like [Actinidia chinensis var. chinensis]